MNNFSPTVVGVGDDEDDEKERERAGCHWNCLHQIKNQEELALDIEHSQY